MPGQMDLRIWDVEHGACAMLHHTLNGMPGRLAMIDSGDASPWTPSATIKGMNRATLDYLFITNADQDHMSDLQGLWPRWPLQIPPPLASQIPPGRTGELSIV